MYVSQAEAIQLLDYITSYDTIIIHRHQRPDPDAVGSQLGLKAVIQQNFPHKKVLAAGTISQGLSWMGTMDSVNQTDYQDALVIVCDTANQPRIDGDYYHLGDCLIKIDHHPPVDPYGDLQIVYPQASSTCEVLVGLLQYVKAQLPLNAAAAALFYTGIVGDTGRFLYQATTSVTHQLVADLLAYPFDASQCAYQLNTISFAEAKFQAFALEHLQLHENHVASLVIQQADIMAYGITEEQTQSVLPLIGQIEGIDSWVVFVEQIGNAFNYRCRIRSKGPVINQIAAQHHGGGHPLASGANVYSPAEMDQLIAEMVANI